MAERDINQCYNLYLFTSLSNCFAQSSKIVNRNDIRKRYVQAGQLLPYTVYSNIGNGLYYQFEFFGTDGNTAPGNVAIVNVNGEA